MIPHWPAGIRQSPRRGQWSGGPQDVRATFEPELGAPISRRRTTGAPRVFEAVFPNLTGAMRSQFEGWFDSDLQAGAVAFSWRDPVDGAPHLWKVIAAQREQAYGLTAKGADLHDLSIVLMRLPGTPWWAPYVRAGESRVPYVVADYANAIFGVAGDRTAASAVAAVAGTFDVYTTNGSGTTEELNHPVAAGDIPATAPPGVLSIIAYIPA